MLGCLNGGAQVRPKDGVSIKELSTELEEMYKSLPVKSPEENKIVLELYESWLGGQESDKCNSVLHTQYHEVQKATNALNIKWWKIVVLNMFLLLIYIVILYIFYLINIPLNIDPSLFVNSICINVKYIAYWLKKNQYIGNPVYIWNLNFY